MLKKDSISVNFLYNMIYQTMLIIMPLITTPYISRVLGVAGVGIYSYTYSYVSVFVMIGSLGIAFYGQREIAAHSNNKNEYSKIFWELETLKIISISISCIVYILISLCSRQYRIYFLIQLPYFLAAILDISWLYQGLEVFRSVAIKNMLIKTLGVISIFCFVKTKSDIWVYLIVLCGAQILGDLSLWIKIRSVVDFVRISISSSFRHFRQVMVYFVPTVSFQIYAFADKAMLGVFTGDTVENGYYEQGLKILNMCMTFISAYTIILRSRMTNYFVDKNWKQFSAQLERSISLIAIVTFPMGFGLAAIAKNFVPWFFGIGYEKVILLIWMSSPLLLIRGIRGCLTSHIVSPCNLMKKGNIVECLATIVNVLLNFFLIPYYASVGALVATAITEILIFVGYIFVCKNYIRFSNIVKLCYKYLFDSFFMFAVIIIMQCNMNASIMNTFALVFVGMFVYILMLVIGRDSFFMDISTLTMKKLNRLINTHR